MKKEEEIQLVTKDLCARLPYDTIISVNDGKYRKDVKLHPHYIFDWDAERWDAKPYLRPMSSMSSKEWVEFCDCSLKDEKSWVITSNSQKFIPIQNREDYLNSKHFDHRGLIPMGLALEAPNGMYNN